MCFAVPDHLLKFLQDNTTDPETKLNLENTRKLSKKLKSSRGWSLLFGVEPEGGGKHRKTCDMHNQEDPLPGAIERVEGEGPVGDKVLDAAHEGAGISYDFMFQTFGRDSLDNKGLQLLSSVHYGKNYSNAYWNGKQMVYGDSDNQLFYPFSLGLDVVCHELQHGITEKTAKLIYWEEPGAGNEHFSDVFGLTIKQWHLNQTVEQADWLVGPEIVGPGFPGKALRSFKNEKAYSNDRQPKHYKNKYIGPEDNFGVHINSGIPNHAYYLFCMKLGGYSFQTPINIWWNTLIRLNRLSRFSDLAKTSIQVAEEFYREPVVTSLKEAWNEVGLNPNGRTGWFKM